MELAGGGVLVPAVRATPNASLVPHFPRAYVPAQHWQLPSD